MLYFLVNSAGEVEDKIDSVNQCGAEYYFMKRKQMKDEKAFYKVWRIKTKKEYDLNQHAFARKPSSEWWKEEETYLDIDAPITKSGK